MATPPNASAANASSTADQTALTNAANAQFIDQANTAIQNAITLGKLIVYVTTFENCDITYLTNYFTGIGYKVLFPDFAPLNGSQPAELFGPDFIAFFDNQLLPNMAKPQNPTRLGLAWSLPTA